MLRTQVIGKLKGLAELWWESHIEDIITGKEFRLKLLHSFRSSNDETDIHVQLIKRRKQRNESYEVIFFLNYESEDIDEESIIKYILNDIY